MLVWEEGKTWSEDEVNLLAKRYESFPYEIPAALSSSGLSLKKGQKRCARCHVESSECKPAECSPCEGSFFKCPTKYLGGHKDEELRVKMTRAEMRKLKKRYDATRKTWSGKRREARREVMKAVTEKKDESARKIAIRRAVILDGAKWDEETKNSTSVEIAQKIRASIATSKEIAAEQQKTKKKLLFPEQPPSKQDASENEEISSAIQSESESDNQEGAWLTDLTARRQRMREQENEIAEAERTAQLAVLEREKELALAEQRAQFVELDNKRQQELNEQKARLDEKDALIDHCRKRTRMEHQSYEMKTRSKLKRSSSFDADIGYVMAKFCKISKNQ